MKTSLHPVFTRVAAFALALLAGQGASAAEAKKTFVYVGTYTDTTSKGIYRLLQDPKSGALTDLKLVAESSNPSFLAVHPSGRYLYAANEDAKETDTVSAFAIDPATGDLKLLNKQKAAGGAPCHLAVDAGGHHVVVANYMGGNFAVLPIAADGTLGIATTIVKHSGSGPNKERQEAPHAHAITFGPRGDLVFVSDLGIDKVVAYRYDAMSGKLTPAEDLTIAVAPGSGPRHFAFSPNGAHAYSLGELTSTVTALDYDAQKASFTVKQTLSTVPADYKEPGNSTAEIAVRPDGRFLYASNRGHDSIAVFSVDAKTGALTLVGHEPTQGKTPRNFTIDPSGRFLYAANQNSDSVVTFAIDAKTGKLAAVGKPLTVPRPVCLLVR